jgi:DNA repair exonuclease SbcCD ATPase subunit
MQEFALVAEMAIGNGVLDRFVVTNDHDRRVLTDLRNKAGCNQDCGIFQMHNSAGRFHIPPPPSADGIETVASVLNIENDLVFNCLVDNARIDVKAVARDKEESERHLLVNKNGQNSIRGHIKQVYLPNGDEWFVRNGALAMFSNERLMRQTLGVDRSAALAAAVSEEAQLKAELKELRKDEAKLESEHREYQRQWNRAKKAVQENDTRISDLTSKIDDIKIEMETSAENTTIDTTEYEEDVQRAEEDVERLKESESKLRAKKEELEPAIADAKSRLDDCNIRNAKVLEDITKAEQEMEQFLQTQSQQNDMVEKKRAKCEKVRSV